MVIRQLIAALKDLPQDLEVVCLLRGGAPDVAWVVADVEFEIMSDDDVQLIIEPAD